MLIVDLSALRLHVISLARGHMHACRAELLIVPYLTSIRRPLFQTRQQHQPFLSSQTTWKHCPHKNAMGSSSQLWRPGVVFSAAILLRIVLLVYGRWQDAHSPVKYTDIDYLVFTDAARYVAHGRSPYERATYRYTPLVAWLLLPTTWGGIWFEFGKVLFAAGDIVTGWISMRILHMRGLPPHRALKFASIWLLNPMVANISTRGSSEGILAALVVALLWATLSRKILLAGCLLGFGVHLKIYPFIYAASIFWWLAGPPKPRKTSWTEQALALINRDRIFLVTSSFLTFMACNLAMYHL